MHAQTPRRALVTALLIGSLACSSSGSGLPGGTGGASSGGATGTGGNTGSAGTTASGGSTASGGTTASGAGGAISAGGTVGTGGATGGRMAAGGMTGAGAAGGPAGSIGTGMGGSPSSTGGSGGAFVGTKTPGSAQAGDITITPATTYQTMDGFGLADVWQSQSSSSAALRTLLFDPDQGIGLSLLRIGIESKTGTSLIMGDAAFVDGPEVAKHGGKVWAAPWSPPANMKDNGNVNNGGHLLTTSYDAWASMLAAFPAYYKQMTGVDLYAISVQNEPDYVATYESCIFNGQQMNAFIKVLAPKLAALNPPVHVMGGEGDLWVDLWGGSNNYGNSILNDPTVSSMVTIIATHDYGSNTMSTTRPSPPAGANITHHIWETEIYYSTGATITAGLDIARGIYAAVTAGGVNAWHYWWTPFMMDGGTPASPPKRVYAMGNFSKFVRPGYVRIAISGAPSTVQIVPFMSPSDGTYAIVALNSATSAQQVSFFVSGTGWPATVTPYVTSAASNLAAGTAITVSGGRFSGSLAAQSVTTFVGKQ